MLIKHQIGALVLSFVCLTSVTAQEAVTGYIQKQADGRYLMNAYIAPNGDTIIYVELREIEVHAPRTFASADDYKRWERYKRLAPTVVPYAQRAIKTFRMIEASTRDGSNRDRKKYIKSLEQSMESQLRDQLKNMTRTQGFLMIEMVERELHMSFFDLVKDVKGGFTAFYWNEFGKLYDYHLKDAYMRGKDPILDSVLDQYDLTN
ncbi:MAG: DUF4294 domain-containing protein [Saprospiraceae bacterium]|nr:DUF4294 domain-containing protein [Saprospiraceae bacterium]